MNTLFHDETRELIDIIKQYIISPLLEFRAIAYNIDAIHYDDQQRFVNNIGALFEGNPPPIQGGGADALLQKMGDYLVSESTTTGQGDGSQSILIDTAGRYCETAANIILDLIAVYPFYDFIAPPFDLPLPIYTSDLVIVSYLGLPDKLYFIYEDQLALLVAMGYERDTWSRNMKQLMQDTSLDQPLPQAPNNLPVAFVTLPPVTLTGVQQQNVQSIMAILATMGLGNVPQSYIEELISEGFSEQDIITAVQGWQAAGKTSQQIADLLYLAAYNILLAPYYRPDMIILGMTADQYTNFVATLRGGLASAGYCAGAGIGGSAVTGTKFISGKPFDESSDYDIVLGNPQLFAKAKALGISVYGGGTRTGPLTVEQLQELGLYDLQQKLQQQTSHEVNFLIYNSLTTSSAGAPFIYQFGNSCN